MNSLVVAHDPAWAAAFEREAGALWGALADPGVRVHHIGRTANVAGKADFVRAHEALALAWRRSAV